MTPDRRGGEPPAGVPLDRYAAVLAMKSEEIPLDEAIQRAGIDARAWPAAERAWEERIAKGDEALLGELDAALAAAQDGLARPVPPIDRDLAAWLDFLRRWAESPAQLELLRSLGLRVEDVFRLQRAWGKKLKDDASLRRKAGQIMQRPPGPMPEIRPEPLALAPLPARPPEPPAPPADDVPPLPPLCAPLPLLDEDVPHLSVEQYASLCVEASLDPAGVPDVLQRYRITPEQRAALDAQWQERIAGDPGTRAAFERAAATYRRWLREQRWI